MGHSKLLLAASMSWALCGAVNSKRGFVGVGCVATASQPCADPVLLSNAGWYYSYNVNDNYGAGAPDESHRFTPMHWCLSSLNDTVPSYVNTTFMMGFNEPNNDHNCNTDAKTIAAAWKYVMATWPNSLLVSPATAGNGIPWFDDFFGNCTAMYGNKCNISYLAVHDYSCEANTTMSYLQQVHERYGYPVWLTEFSCEDGAAKRPTADQLTYMKQIIPLLDASPFVYRYSWMSARDSDTLRALVTVDSTGKTVLTELGQLYNSL